MPAMLDTISAMVSASLPLSAALQVNTDTTVFATLPALMVLALKATTAREHALLVPGAITTAATDTALPSTPPMMLVLTPALEELPSPTVSALAPPASTSMPRVNVFPV